jgi:hypothetical protein
MGYNLHAAENHLEQEKQHLAKSAFDAFHNAQLTDSSDHLAEYYLALQFTYGCQSMEAMINMKMTLNLQSEHVLSVHLLVFLLCAQTQHIEALQLIEAALDESPDNLNLRMSQASKH